MMILQFTIKNVNMSLKSTAALLEMLIIMNTCHATYGSISWMLRASHQSELNPYMFAYQIQS